MLVKEDSNGEKDTRKIFLINAKVAERLGTGFVNRQEKSVSGFNSHPWLQFTTTSSSNRKGFWILSPGNSVRLRVRLPI